MKKLSLIILLFSICTFGNVNAQKIDKSKKLYGWWNLPIHEDNQKDTLLFSKSEYNSIGLGVNIYFAKDKTMKYHYNTGCGYGQYKNNGNWIYNLDLSLLETSMLSKPKILFDKFYKFEILEITKKSLTLIRIK